MELNDYHSHCVPTYYFSSPKNRPNRDLLASHDLCMMTPFSASLQVGFWLRDPYCPLGEARRRKAVPRELQCRGQRSGSRVGSLASTSEVKTECSELLKLLNLKSLVVRCLRT